MKKGLLITLTLLMAVSMLYAGDNNSNISTGYLRMPVRNAVINNLDATIFNPAGTTELEDGFHIGVQNEVVLRNYSFDSDTIDLTPAALGSGYVTATDGESDYNSYLFPTIMAAYTRDNWAAYFTFTVPGGGGEVNYEPLVSANEFLFTGTPTLDMTDVDVNAYFAILGYTVGGAYKFFDKLSVSAAVRVLQATKETKFASSLGAIMDTEDDAVGVGGIFGINYMPMDTLNIAMRYETPVKMEYDSSGTGAADYRQDFPAYFGMGVGYQVIPKLRLMADFGFNFYKLQAENTDSLDEDDIDDAWSLGLGAEYEITDRFLVSTGVVYTDSGINEDSASYTTSLPIEGVGVFEISIPNPNPDLGRTTIGMGGQFEVIEDLKIEAGYMIVLYRGEEDSTGFEYDKDVHAFSLGASYHF